MCDRILWGLCREKTSRPMVYYITMLDTHSTQHIVHLNILPVLDKLTYQMTSKLFMFLSLAFSVVYVFHHTF